MNFNRLTAYFLDTPRHGQLAQTLQTLLHVRSKHSVLQAQMLSQMIPLLSNVHSRLLHSQRSVHSGCHKTRPSILQSGPVTQARSLLEL
jgi:hypothetical protein